jgi:tetratricopeptide (TPR) repeat protein
MLDQAEGFVAHSDRGILLHQRAFILWQNGRLVEALEWFAIAEPALKLHGPDWIYAALFHNRASVWRELGELEKGLASEQLARKLFAGAGYHVNSAKALHNEALLWLDLGDVTRAIAGFEEVRPLYREHAPELEAYVNDSYAESLMRVGMYRQAAEHWDEAIASWRFHGNLRSAAIAEFMRAVVALESGDHSAAEEWARRSMDSLYQMGIETWSFLARLLVLQARFDGSREGPDFPTKVDVLCAALEDRGWTFRTDQARILAARAYIRVGDYETARERLAMPIEGDGYGALSARLAQHLALAELMDAESKDPLPMVRAGLDMLDEYRATFGSAEFQAGVSGLGRQLAGKGLGVACKSSDPELVLTWTERSRAQAFLIPPVKATGEPHVREALGRLRQARQRLWDAQLGGATNVAELMQRVRELEEEIRVNGWATPGPGHQVDRVLPTTIGSLAEEKNTVLISQFACDGLLQAVLALDGELLHVKLGDLEAAAEIGSRLGADIDALGAPFAMPPRLQQSVESSLRRNGEALAKEVWDPIAELVGDRSIVMIPHSRLRWVPWPLLPQLRGVPLTVAPSAEAWYRAVNRPAATGPALIAAGPALHRASNEIDEVSKLYPGARLICDSDSDPVAVLEALDGASVAHLAAHGHHEPDNVLFSRLNFARGPLNAYELLSLDQAPAHVVLSSCELGRSNVAVGDESLGFTAALLHAGTATVVSSLGRVPDELAADMMIDYHRRCAAGATPAEALAAAGEQRPWHPFVCFGA